MQNIRDKINDDNGYISNDISNLKKDMQKMIINVVLVMSMQLKGIVAN